jgi:hypothetical protein
LGDARSDDVVRTSYLVEQLRELLRTTRLLLSGTFSRGCCQTTRDPIECSATASVSCDAVGSGTVVRSQKTQPTEADVEAFLNAVPDPGRRDDARKLCRLLRDITGEPAALWGPSIVGFGAYSYRYPSGHEGTSALVGFSPRRRNLVVYLVGGFQDRYPALVDGLGPHKAGRGCLYLKRLADVDLDVVRLLVERSIAVHRAQDRAATST